jgi:hypothetical protein
MIALLKTARRKKLPPAWQDRFLAMLPQIREQARLACRASRAEAKEEFISEVLANTYCAYSRLVQRGREDLAYATPLALYAIRQVRCGRRVGSRLNIRDITSPYAQAAKGIVIERLDQFNKEDCQWREVLIEDRKAGPADTAAARIDVAAWFKTLACKKRMIAKALARGESTATVAQMFELSAARVSQLRRELQQSWEEFQEEPAFD